MSDSTSTKWVPASLVRIRCFLNRRGMKVKPWLGPDAVLDAFYSALRSQTQHDAFWSELEALLEDLARDMNERVCARGWVIHNELLDQTTHAELLAQIRQAIGIEELAAEGLKPLAKTLPVRAGALLLMLAAAIVVGCGGETDNSHVAGVGGSTSASLGGASALGGTPAGSGGTPASSIGAMPMGGRLIIGTPNHSPSGPNCVSAGTTSGLDPAQFAACNPKLVEALIPYDIHSDSGKPLLQCLCLLNDAWQTGFAELFSGQSCESIANYFGDCGMDQLCAASSAQVPQDFDADLFVDNCAIVIYVGVRCD